MSEKNTILRGLCSVPNFWTTTDKKTAKEILEHGFLFCQGHMVWPKIEHLGLGVYKIWAEKE